MRPVIKVVESYDGHIILSKEEFEDIINKTYEQGVEDGRRVTASGDPYINQQQPFTIPIWYTTMATPDKAAEDVIIDAVIQTLESENEND